MSPRAWDAADPAPAAPFAAGSFYHNAAGVRFGDRAVSRPAAPASPTSFAAAVASFARALP